LVIPAVISMLIIVSMLSGCVVPGGVLTVRWEHADKAGTKVKLVGVYFIVDEIEDFNVSFVWDTEKHPSWKGYPNFVKADGYGPLNSFYVYIHGLDRTVTYHFRTVGEFLIEGKSRWVQGFDKTFTPGLPEVSTRNAKDVTNNLAVLCGELTHMGGAESCDVWFEYDEQDSDESPPNHYGFSTDPQTKTSTGEFSSLVGDLKSNTTYYFRAVASNDVGKDYGLRLNFTTSENFL